MDAETLKSFVRAVPDFPKPGILYRDISPVLASEDALRASVRHLAQPFREADVDLVLGIESRGFIFGALVAQELNVGFVPIRKPGKLPCEVLSEEYSLEYGTDKVEMHADAIQAGQNVVVIDDVIATGGTAAAALALAEKAGASLTGLGFLIELVGLGGREKLRGHAAHSVIRY